MSFIWVTGANGQVGNALQRLIHSQQVPWDVRFFTRLEFDLTDPTKIALWFAKEQPQCVINLAAYTAVDRAEAEPEVAYAVNATGVGNLVTLCALHHVPLIHVSTDYVFSGQGEVPYEEEMLTAPQSVYGHSKALGEELIRASHAAHIILRTSWVFAADAENFVTKILRKGFHQRCVSVIADQIGCPTAADNLAIVLCHLTTKILVGQATYGTYHYCDRDVYSWFSFAQKIFKLAAEQNSSWQNKMVLPVSTSAYPTPATRPAYSVLNVGKLTRDYGMYPMSCIPALEHIVQKTVEKLHHVSA